MQESSRLGMTTDAWITLAVLVVTFTVLAFDRLPAASAMGAAVGVLLLAGVIDQEQALSGLASSAPVTIAALYVLAGAATVTGALSPMIDRVLGGRTWDRWHGNEHRSNVRRLGRLSFVTGAISAVLPNTPFVALAAPRVVTWWRRAGVSASPYLMPLSYAAVFGGVVTVIGTSTNLVVFDLLVSEGGPPLGVFEITSVGLPVAAIGIGMMVLTAPRLLRGRDVSPTGCPSRRAPGDARQPYTIALAVEPDGPLVGRTVDGAGLRHLRGVFLAGVERARTIVAARPGTVLGAGDICYFAGDVVESWTCLRWTDSPAPNTHTFSELPTGPTPGCSKRSCRSDRSWPAARCTTPDSVPATTLRCSPPTPRRRLPGKLGTLVLRPGDVLLVLARPEFERQWRGQSDFSVIASLDTPAPARRHRAWPVVAAIVGMVAVVVTNVLDLMEASLLAAVALVAFTGHQPERGAPLGEPQRGAHHRDVDQPGDSRVGQRARRRAGDGARQLGNPFGDIGHIVAVLAATMILTELLSNNAAAALMVPVATATALDAGLDPRSFAIVVLIGASCSFLSPIGYQTNLMVYGLGGYRFNDFTIVGLPLTMVTLIVTPIAVVLFLPM